MKESLKDLQDSVDFAKKILLIAQATDNEASQAALDADVFKDEERDERITSPADVHMISNRHFIRYAMAKHKELKKLVYKGGGHAVDYTWQYQMALKEAEDALLGACAGTAPEDVQLIIAEVRRYEQYRERALELCMALAPAEGRK